MNCTSAPWLERTINDCSMECDRKFQFSKLWDGNLHHQFTNKTSNMKKNTMKEEEFKRNKIQNQTTAFSVHKKI